MGSLPGAMAGAAVLTWLPQFLKAQVPQPGPADVDRRARPGHDDLPAGRPDPGQAPQGRAARASTRRRRPRSRPSRVGGVVTWRTVRPRRRRRPRDPRRRLRRRARDAALRRRRQPQRRLAADAPRRDPRRHRPERRRQDLAVQLAHRRLHAAGGRDHARRPRRATPPTSVIGKKTHVVNHLGVARTFQNIRLFPALTALENVKVGIETRQQSGPIAAMLGMPWQRREETREHPAGARRCCARSGWPSGPTSWPARWPTASSGGSRSPARSAPTPACCCSTSRPPAPTRPRSATSPS